KAMLSVHELPAVVLVVWPESLLGNVHRTIGGLPMGAEPVGLRMHVGAEQHVVELFEQFNEPIGQYGSEHDITVSPRRDDLGYAFTACVAIAIRAACGGRVSDPWRFWLNTTDGHVDTRIGELRNTAPFS